MPPAALPNLFNPIKLFVVPIYLLKVKHGFKINLHASCATFFQIGVLGFLMPRFSDSRVHNVLLFGTHRATFYLNKSEVAERRNAHIPAFRSNKKNHRAFHSEPTTLMKCQNWSFVFHLYCSNAGSFCRLLV